MKNKIPKTATAIGVFFVLFSPAQAQIIRADDILGKWVTADNSMEVTIYKSIYFYYGKITAVNGEQRDVNNPDASLKDRSLLNLVVLQDVKYDRREESWSNGTLYEPRDGKTYRCQISFFSSNKQKLKVRIFMPFSIKGRIQSWTKAN
ncbi:MAG: DUF2147 domain-containing protein [Cytophagales bacterium]|jgi:uncharacterized protein (DUF2147 family)|nr:DUF2147 domain-containing protein [Cytophagales bacterium]